MKWLVVLLGLASSIVSSSVIGVSPENQHLYRADSSGKWACLSDPSIKLDLNKINDDFCDCPDGSDEPGTAACANNLFYCVNDGHIGNYIASHKVNDGVCDYDLCCDGSDEWNSPVSCPNRCKELQQQYLTARNLNAQRVQKGLGMKKSIIDQAKRKVHEIEEKVLLYDEALVVKKTELTKLNEEIADMDEDVQSLSGLVNEKLSPHLESINNLILDQSKTISGQSVKLDKLQTILRNLIDNYNPNFNDLAVKEAVQNFQDYLVNSEEEQELQQEDKHTLIVEIAKDIETLEDPEESNETGECDIYYAVHQAYQNVLDSFLGVEKPTNAKSHKRISSKKQAEVDTLSSHIESISKEISNFNEDLKSNIYGPDDIFRAFENDCVTNKLGEYDYKYCFSSTIHQNGNGQSSLIGTFHKVEVQDSKLVAYYEDGAKCWNGPKRRGVVNLICGDKPEVLSVSEPEKCEYHFVVVSPVGCFETDLEEFPFEINYDELK